MGPFAYYQKITYSTLYVSFTKVYVSRSLKSIIVVVTSVAFVSYNYNNLFILNFYICLIVLKYTKTINVKNDN